MEERLQKLLSAAGVCSRRAAEDYLTAGRVTVNGETARLGQKADLDRDEILVDGAPLKGPEKWVYLMLNKPRGYVTTPVSYTHLDVYKRQNQGGEEARFFGRGAPWNREPPSERQNFGQRP